MPELGAVVMSSGTVHVEEGNGPSDKSALVP